MQCRRPQFGSWVGRSDRLLTPVFLGFPCGSTGKETTCNGRDLGWEDPLKKGKATHRSVLAWRIPWTVQSTGSQRVIFGLFSSSVSKESACNAGDPGSIPRSGRSPGEGNGNPLQYSWLENPHGQRGLAGYSPWGRKSQTQLSD